MKEQKLKRYFSGYFNDTYSKSDKVNLHLIKYVIIKKNNEIKNKETEKQLKLNEENQKNEIKIK